MLTNSFYADIQKIHVAHQYTLDRMHVCTYPKGRGHYGLVFALRGEAEYRFSSGEQVQMATGNLLFLSPDTAYTIITSAEFEHYTVNFVLHEEQSDLGVAGDAYCLLQSEDTAPLERVFRKLVRARFSQRRKTLMNSVSSAGFGKEMLGNALDQCGIERTARIEQLTMEQLAALSRALTDNK